MNFNYYALTHCINCQLYHYHYQGYETRILLRLPQGCDEFRGQGARGEVRRGDQRNVRVTAHRNIVNLSEFIATPDLPFAYVLRFCLR